MKLIITKDTANSLRAGKLRNDDGSAASSIADTKVGGFMVRTQASGALSFFYRYRKSGAAHILSLGSYNDPAPLKEAHIKGYRRQAADAALRVTAGANPASDVKEQRASKKREASAARNTVDALLDEFLEKYVRAQGRRSADEIERTFKVYVRPRLGDRSIYSLVRSDVVKMLDDIAKNNGPVMADRVLAHVRKAFNWHATRDDDFTPPIVRGMARTSPKALARKRTLADDEIREIWSAMEDARVSEPFTNVLRSILLTAQRPGEVSGMNAAELDGDVWIIPAARYKTNVQHAVPITRDARRYIGTRTNGFMFSSKDGRKPFNNWSNAKEALDAVIAERRKKASKPAMENWTPHDLRRTARTLMSRAKVPSDHAEVVLGHVPPGVRKTYDRWSYPEEKRDALNKLAALVRKILA